MQCGGEKGALAAAEPYLRLMGKNIVNCGPSGNGQAAKVSSCIPVHVFQKHLSMCCVPAVVHRGSCGRSQCSQYECCMPLFAD